MGGGDDILAKAGDDTVRGGEGFDIIRGELGDDRLFGEADGGFIVGGRGNDLVVGGADTDCYSDEANGADGNDSYDGGAGFDDIEFRNDAQTAGVRLTLGVNGAVSRAVQGAEVDSVRGIENVDGTDAADFVAGNNLRNSIQGLDGADRLEGRGGDDFLTGGGELDDARFGRSLTVDGGAGDDEIVGVGAVERTLAGTGADKVTSSLDPFDFPARVDTVDLGADRQSDTLTQLVELFPVDTDTPAYGFGVDRVTNFRAEDRLAVEFILDPERVNVADRLDSDGNGRVDDADQDVRLEGRDLVLDLDAVIRQVPLGEFLPDVDQHVVLVNTVSFDADQLI